MSVAALGLPLSPALPQAAANLIVVDVAAVAQGYRASKLIHSRVVNDQNEKIGHRSMTS